MQDPKGRSKNRLIEFAEFFFHCSTADYAQPAHNLSAVCEWKSSNVDNATFLLFLAGFRFEFTFWFSA
jgi:hypothetical protein